MTPETLAALRGSIEKWDRIAAQEDVDRGTDNCPLCSIFWGRRGDRGNHCEGCPVFIATGAISCVRTPYINFCHMTSSNGYGYAPKQQQKRRGTRGYYASTPRQIAAARAMADFLRGLLPKEE